ncbi:MAG: hypothetical protein ACXVZW_10000 [Gaiellaceae bacterium]
MRTLTERLKGRKLDLLDGIKLYEETGWAQVLADPDEPLLHIYAEGESEEGSGELERTMRELVEEIVGVEAPPTPEAVPGPR